MSEKLFELNNRVKTYGKGDGIVHALKGIDLQFRKNEFVAILGPSGCGKTTMLNIIGGLDRGIDYTEFNKALSQMDIDNIVCLPETGHNTADVLAEIGCKAKVVKVADLPEAVQYAKANTKWGKACIMSPAAASYNIYRDFEEKGNHYKQLVMNKA